MTAEPYDEGAIHHLYRALFYGSLNVFVYFAGTRGPNSPSSGSIEISGYDEPPAGQQTLPGCYFDGNSILNTFERVVDTPVVLGVAGLGRRTWPMGFGWVVVDLIGNLGQRSVPD